MSEKMAEYIEREALLKDVDEEMCCENCINYNVDRDEQPCCCCFDFLCWEEENDNDR